MVCKGVCPKYKAEKPVGTGRYASGQRRCQTCEIYIKWEGLWCPCCGCRLRTKPRNLKYKAKLRSTSIRAGEEVAIRGTPHVLIEFKLQTDKGQKWLVRNRTTNKESVKLIVQ